MASFNIALIGECMIELQDVGGTLRQGFGGDTLNTAVYLSRLTANKALNVSYVTALGTDKVSQGMVDNWLSEGINDQFIQRSETKQPGIYIVDTDDTGERSFMYWRADSAAKYWLETASEELLENLLKQDAIYLSGISLAILPVDSREKLYALLTEYKAAGGKVIFDNNYRPKLWDSQEQAVENYKKILSVTHTGLLTFDDEEAVFGDTCIEDCIQRSLALGVTEIVIKRGSKECLVITADDQISVKANLIEKSKVIDTNAAGDSYTEDKISRRIIKKNSEASAMKAHNVAATVIQHKGAIIDAQFIAPFVD